MSQVTTGFRSFLGNQMGYRTFQYLMGAHSIRKILAKDFICSTPRCKILDIGCGPADILAYLPDVAYTGFDISSSYIDKAKTRFGSRASFICRELTSHDVEAMPKVDIVLALGLIHHLDDKEAKHVFDLACEALKPGGRMLTLDPCIEEGQNPIARFLINNDRGQNVRNKNEYIALIPQLLELTRAEVRHKVWIPYTHCFIECTRS
jgi:SAM-dependent methyltransferase